MLVLIPLGAAARGETDQPWNPLASSLPIDVAVSEVRTQPRKAPIELRYTLRFEPTGERMRISDRGLASVRLQGRELEPADAWGVAKLLLPVMEIDESAGEPIFPENDRGWRRHYLDVIASANRSPEVQAVQRAAAGAMQQQSGTPAQMLWLSLGIILLDEGRRESGVDWDAFMPTVERALGRVFSVRRLPDGPPPESLERMELVAVIPEDEVRADIASLVKEIEDAVAEASEKPAPMQLGEARVVLVLGIAPESGQLREISLESSVRTGGDPARGNVRLTSQMRLDWLGASPDAQQREGFRLGACDARQIEVPVVWSDVPPDDSEERVTLLMCGSGVVMPLDDGATLRLRRIASGEQGLELQVRHGDREWSGTNERDPQSIELADEAGHVVAQASVAPSTQRAVYADVVNRPARETARQLALITDVPIAGEQHVCDERITLKFDGISFVSLATLLADVCGLQFVSVETTDGILGAFRPSEADAPTAP
jgi:hypothetical protein